MKGHGPQQYRKHIEAVEAMRSGNATGQPPVSSSPTQAAERRAKARTVIPEDLRATYDALYDDYQFYAFKNTGFKLVSAEVCRDLVLAGWRKDEDGMGGGAS